MVNIAVKKGEKYNDGLSAFITFPYTPHYVNIMRAQPKRFWHGDIKAWEIPYDNLNLVIDKLTENEYKIIMAKDIAVEIETKEEVKIPEGYVFKTKPYQHQIEGIEYGLNHKKFLLGDEQGCVDGDMEIYYSLNGKSYSNSNSPKSTLARLYNLWKTLKPTDVLKVHSFIGHCFKTNRVKEVVYSGRKPVYKLILDNELTINVTEDHEIFTMNRGFVPFNQLVVDSDEVLCYQTTGKILGKEFVGIKDTYDIKMEAPYHNFVANNIVVHNCGKAQPYNSVIYTPNGKTFMGNLEIGSMVLGSDGNAYAVTNIYERGNLPVYRITFSDRSSTLCCADHLWNVGLRRESHNGKYKTVDTKALLNVYKKHRYYIPMCSPVKFAEKQLINDLPPYVLGVLLGDKCINYDISVCSLDEYVVNKVKELIPDFNQLKISLNLDILGLKIPSNTKFIPDNYKYNTVENRIQLLQGLVDADGYIRTGSGMTYTSVSEQLLSDVMELVESLGGTATRDVRRLHTISFRLPRHIQSCTLPKKLDKINPYRLNPNRIINNIEYVGEQQCRCITVNSPDALYLTDHFICTHNTKQMIDLACIKKQMYGYEHCLVIACVNGLKYNWQTEVGIHSNESGYILGTRINRKGKATIGSNKDRLDDLKNIDNIKDYFIITNIETLRYTATEQQECKTKAKNGSKRYKKVTTFPIVEELQKLIMQGKISMIIADEIHKCFSENTQILTDKGLVPIVKITNDKCYKVATRTESGNIDYVEPTNYFVNPIPHEALELSIQTNQGVKTIICTKNHKFLTSNRGYVEAQYLTSDDDIVEV